MITGSISKEVRINNFFISESRWMSAAALSMTGDEDEANDLTSLIYEKLCNKSKADIDKIAFADSLNKSYVHLYMKGRFLNGIRDNKMEFEEDYNITTIPAETGYSDELEEFQMEFIDSINAYLDELATSSDPNVWFGARLFKLKLDTDKSFEQLAKETTISKSVLFTTHKKMRLHLEEVFKEQYDKLNKLRQEQWQN